MIFTRNVRGQNSSVIDWLLFQTSCARGQHSQMSCESSPGGRNGCQSRLAMIHIPLQFESGTAFTDEVTDKIAQL